MYSGKKRPEGSGQALRLKRLSGGCNEWNGLRTPVRLRLRRCEWSKGLPKGFRQSAVFGSGYAWLLPLKKSINLKANPPRPAGEPDMGSGWVFCGFLELAENSGKKDKENCHEGRPRNAKGMTACGSASWRRSTRRAV